MTREVIERMILGNRVRVTVDVLEDGRARVIEYRRTRPGRERGERVRHMRGVIVTLAQLGASESEPEPQPVACQPAAIAWRQYGGA